MGKVIILKNGKKLPIIKEEGKYLYVKGTQFKKGHPDISEIIEEKAVEEGFEKLPNMKEVEKEIETEKKIIENIAAESDSKAKNKAKREE